MSKQSPLPTLLAQALQQLLDTATGGSDLGAITLPAAATPTAPALLARGLSLHNAQGRPRPQAENAQLYTRCLALYRERVQTGATQDDLGCAAALFVTANLTALGHEGGDVSSLKALTQQMQNALQRLPAWSSLSLLAKQQLFEQLAILSVLIAQASEAATGQGPQARDNVRAAAQAYLRQWLAVDPACLSLSSQGLVVSPQAVAQRTQKVLSE